MNNLIQQFTIQRSLYISILLSLIVLAGNAQEIIPLWTGEIPNSQASDEKETRRQTDLLWIQNVQQPTLEVYLPTQRNATGQAVVICPGGGYFGLAYDWEGTDVAKFLNSKGVAAFVLKSRLPGSKSVVTRQEAPLQDAQRALRLVRFHAEKWNVNPDKIGVMGFSAGGHLASTLGTHYDEKVYAPQSEADQLSARPNFMILVYPVISMKENITHGGSKANLLGEQPSDELVQRFSNESQVNESTPPTFLVHAGDDDAVPVANSLLFYQALIKSGVPTEMHIYPEGGHGFALAIGGGHHKTWINRLAEWLESL